jgi:Protein of unknown function (DUF2478)
VSFDAQCDLAAVVYGADDDPDRVISGFTADLRRSGRRPVGVVQLGRSCRAENPRLGAVVLPDGEVVRLAPHEATPAATFAAGCRLDPDRLAGLACRLAAAIEDGADLVVINRFGRSEAEGKGLIDLIPQALAADIPVLIAVPEQRFAAWIRFSEGMNGSPAAVTRSIDGGCRSRVLPGGAAAPVRSASSRNEARDGAGEFAVVDLDTPMTSNPPFVIDVVGEVAPDGEAIGLRIQRSAQGPVDLCLRTEDVQNLISILLALSCEAKRLQPPPEFEVPPGRAIPLPVSTINVGQTEDDQTFLLLEVGTASLMFGVPPATWARSGRRCSRSARAPTASRPEAVEGP